MKGGSNGPVYGASDELNDYWTKGAGLAKWANSATPYRTLLALLLKYIENPERARGLAAIYYHKVKGEWPGKHGGNTNGN